MIARFLEGMLGRLPIGWLQLVHNRTRLAAALAGVAFANILIFIQLGFLGALVNSIAQPYQAMKADLIVSASDANTLADGSPLPRQRMFEALPIEGVKSATPLFFSKMDWKQPDGTIRTLDVFGVDPAARAFRSPDINHRLADLTRSDVAVIDALTRNVPPALFRAISDTTPYVFEARGRTLTVIDTFRIGGGFSADGALIVSDQTFLRLFPQRASGAPNHILIQVESGFSPKAVAASLSQVLPSYDSVVRTVDEAIAKDQRFQTTQRPVGIIFGFGTLIGILVGIIIVYQVLSSDVADHMKEYATFKAIGYPQGLFNSIVFEEALVLAVLGFLPGIVIAVVLYFAIASATGLPLAMTPVRAIGVLVGTMLMCVVAGAIATRRLARANPADLF